MTEVSKTHHLVAWMLSAITLAALAWLALDLVRQLGEAIRPAIERLPH